MLQPTESWKGRWSRRRACAPFESDQLERSELQDRRIRIGDTYLGVIYFEVIAKEMRMTKVRK